MSTNPFSAAIASSGNLSSSVHIGDNIILAVVVPANWTTATVTFQGSIDNSTFYNLNDDTGTEVSVTVAAGESSQVPDPLIFAPWNYIKVRSGASGSEVNQPALTVLLLGDESL
jgi:hypothetical protein